MKKIILLSLFVCCGASVALAQEKPMKETPYIEVNAVAEKEIVPNNIFIKITLLERVEGKDKVEIEVQEKDLKEGLNALQIPIKQLELQDANADYVRIKRAGKQVLSRKEYVLLVKDAKEASEVFQLLDRLKIYEANIFKTTHSRIDSITKEVRIEAMKAGKAKAEYMLAAINEKPGKPIIVYEVKPNYISPLNTAQYRSGGSIKMSNADSEEIGFEKIKVRVEVYIKYEIKQ